MLIRKEKKTFMKKFLIHSETTQSNSKLSTNWLFLHSKNTQLILILTTS